ncbi:MAG: hypothetical protein AAF489_08810 [Bacteroidota bacterium]
MQQKTKNRCLVAGVMLLLIVAYQLTFSRTFALRKEIGQMELRIAELKQRTRQASSLEQREYLADSILNKFRIKNRSVQNHLLDFLNEESRQGDLLVTEFVASHTMTNDGVTTHSYPFKLKGSYHAMERVLYEMEQQYTFGKVAHVSFERKNNFRKRTRELECYVIVERLEVE